MVRQLVEVGHLLVQLPERDLHTELLAERGGHLCEEERIEAHFKEGLLVAHLGQFKSGTLFKQLLDLRDERILG